MDSLMQLHIMYAASGVAAGVILPVLVLIKSAPASIASSDAIRISFMFRISPDSKITFKCASSIEFFVLQFQKT